MSNPSTTSTKDGSGAPDTSVAATIRPCASIKETLTLWLNPPAGSGRYAIPGTPGRDRVLQVFRYLISSGQAIRHDP